MRPDQLHGAPVLVAGAGISGLAAAEALVALGAEVTVTDAVPARLADLPAGARPGADPGADPGAVPPGTALIVTSPGRRPDHPLVATAAAAGIPLVGEPELAWWIGQARPRPPAWLVVTGTNGKTTTVGMLESMLRAAGLSSVACGNIGFPVVTAVAEGHEVLAVELSSFQLHWSPSIRPAAGCVLNVAADHLDWHGTLAAYAQAKARALLGPVAVAGIDDAAAAKLLAASPAPRKIGVTLGVPGADQVGIADGALVDRAFGGGALAGVADVTPAGPTGLTDALAAAALARAHGVAPGAVRDGLTGFRPGPHRGGVVATVAGVDYVDDSKATNPHAAHSSLQSRPTRVVWIVGGLLKGSAVDELVAANAQRLRAAVVIGTERAEIVTALARHAPDVPVVEVATGDDAPMTTAVQHAAALAAPGDVVLLAPAAASMDQFVDYAHRGRAFADAVAALPGSTPGSTAGSTPARAAPDGAGS